MRALCTESESLVRLMDEAECYRQLRQLRWPDGQVRCPSCDGTTIVQRFRYHRQPACWRYRCGTCQTTFNDKTGTLFADTKLPLRAWFLGFYLAQLSHSTSEIARELPCDYHTAHRIVWLVRAQLVRLEAGRQLCGTVEVDEIYVTAGHKGQAQGGGKKGLAFPPRRRAKRQPRGRGSAAQDRPALLTLVSRETGMTILHVVPDVARRSLAPVFQQRLAPGSTVYTDSAGCYQILDDLGYQHESVNHSSGEYVRGAVHENRAETLWSLFLPWLARFRGVSQDNLPAYVTYFQFLRNYRTLSAWQRAILVLTHTLERYAQAYRHAAAWLRDAHAHPIPI